MSGKDLVPAAVGAVVTDVLSIFMIPGSTVGLAIQKMLEARLTAARDIFLEEIAAGERPASDVISEDAIAAISYRFYRAAQEGAARLNLRLLAQCVAGQIRNSDLRADEFLYYADILSTLKRDEIVVLGSAIRHQRDYEREKIEKSIKTVEEEDEKLTSIHQRVSVELIASAMFPTDAHLITCMGSLQRTGLIRMASGWGSLVMVPSPRLAEVEMLIDIEAALKKEP